MSGFNTFVSFLTLPFRVAGTAVRVTDTALNAADKLIPIGEVVFSEWTDVAQDWAMKGACESHKFVKNQKADVATYKQANAQDWAEVEALINTKK